MLSKKMALPMTLSEFFLHYNIVSLTEEQLSKLKVKEEKVVDDLLKGAPPCLISIAKQGIPNGQRNNAIYNFGVYCKKRYTDGIQKYLNTTNLIVNHR